MAKKATSYTELIKFCKNLYVNKTQNIFKLKIDKSKSSLKIVDGRTTVLDYDIECQEIVDFFSSLFEMTENKYEAQIFVSAATKHQFIMNYDILNLLLSIEYLKSKGVSPVHSFKLKSKSGKIRDISAPNDLIKPILQNLNVILQKTYDSRNSNFQVAYKKGMNIKTNALPHANNDYVFKIDLHNFFPSCKRERVEKYVKFLFKNVINAEFVKNKFLDAILLDDALYIGNPISGTLANAIISAPVAYMRNICNKFDMVFTVYADDMTFSSSKFITKDFVVNIFNSAFVRYNMENDFSLSVNKCYGVSKANRSVTGVAINHENKVTCHRYVFNNIRQTLHQMSYGDMSHYNFNKLQGQISFMMMLDETDKLKNLLTKYEAVVRQYGLVSDEKLSALIGK